MSINLKFKEFATENLKIIPHPTGKNKSVELNDIISLCDLLFSFLNYELEEPTLKRVKSNFELEFEKVYELDRKELPGAIEGLATNFESFLKKIAFIKFENQVLWKGDGVYKGITKCTLFELIEGKSSKISPNVPGDDFKFFPSPIVNNTGTSKGILDFVRSELRNAVHSANPYTRAQLIQYSNLVLGAYLIAVNDNVLFFKKRFFPEINYLETIVNSKEFVKLSKHYIDLLGKEEIFDFDNIAIERLDGQKLIDSITLIENEDVSGENETLEVLGKEIARIDSVINISKDTKRFIIIGEPGSGKTTSLQKILYDNAREILNGSSKSRLPVYIKASSYSPTKSFLDLVHNEISFLSFEELISKHNVLILIDGLNEIEDDFKRLALNDLRKILNEYENVDFIISSRKFGFYNHWDLDVFELKKLNENQIQQLIVNTLDISKGQVLWKQLEKNKQILDLSHNPLMLMMIIKVSSLTNNEIPANKGLLYKLFNEAILAREQKHYSTDIDTKKDILSHLAFWMRKNGIFKKIKKAQAKELVKIKLGELNHSLGVNEILNELSDNNFFIGNNEELEFYHETQQEYFVALEIQNLFFRNKNLNFDYSDTKWFEPIFICSDLFTNDKDRLEFFEFIYIGTKNSIPKYLNQFTSEDVEPKFYIACKVAYNLKGTHPSLFNKAEHFLSNYLAIWRQRFYDNVEIIDFKYLLKAIASLSSDRLFKMLFYNLDYLVFWFYNKEIDDRTGDENTSRIFEERYNEYCKVFVDDLNDFPLLYRTLNYKLKAYNTIHTISKSIHYYVKFFYKYLLRNSPITQLIQAFKETKNKELLMQIGISDLDFFIENFFLLEKSNEADFYNFICKFHLHNILGINFLIKSLKNDQLDLKARLLILNNLLDNHELVETVLPALRELLDKQDLLMFFDETKTLLNQFPLERLNRHGLDRLYTYPEIEKIDIQLNLVTEVDDFFIFESHNNNLDYKEILKNVNNIHCNDKPISFLPFLGDKNYRKESKVLVIHGVPKTLNFCFDKFYQGGSFSIHFFDDKRQSRTETFLFKELFKSQNDSQLLMEIDYQIDNKIRGIYKRFRTIKVLIGQEFRFSIKGFGSHFTSIFLKCKKTDIETPTNENVFQLYKINLDYNKPFNYHRDILKLNGSFLRYISTQVNQAETVNFIKQIGLVHVFTNQINNWKAGVVVAFWAEKNVYTIYKLDDHKFVESSFIKSIQEEVIKVNDIVLIEENLNISKLNATALNEQYFLESEILSTNSSNTEGFIKTLDDRKDFYFTFNFCSFKPEPGVIVRFIPGINFSKGHSTKPMAYCISKIGDNKKLAKIYNIIEMDNHLDVYLTDMITGEKLFARIYSNYTNKMQAKIGEIWNYYIPNKYSNSLPGNLRRITVTRKQQTNENYFTEIQ
jgi:hypothetical protein